MVSKLWALGAIILGVAAMVNSSSTVLISAVIALGVATMTSQPRTPA